MFKREGAQSSDLVSVLPLRDLVVFPGMTVPLIVGRPASQAAVNRAWEGSQSIFLLTQRTGSASHPDHADLYDVGTVGRVLQRGSRREPEGPAEGEHGAGGSARETR